MSDSNEPAAMQERRDIVGKKLQDREDERIKESMRRKEESEKFASKTESTNFFLQTVNSGVTEIRDGIAAAGDRPKDDIASYFDELSLKLGALQKFVSDSTMFLSAFDLGQSQNLLKDIQAEIATHRDVLLPKKKFAFKNRKKQTAPKPDISVGDISSAPSAAAPQVSLEFSANECRKSGISLITLEISADEVRDKDMILSSVKDSTVKVKGVPSAMHLTDIVDSTVICGPCSR